MTAGQIPGENGKSKISTGDLRCVTMPSRVHHRSNSYIGSRLQLAKLTIACESVDRMARVKCQ
jgi:hypothetical protein